MNLVESSQNPVIKYLEKDGSKVTQISEEILESNYRKQQKPSLVISTLAKGDVIEFIELHHWIVKVKKPLNGNFFLKMIK